MTFIAKLIVVACRHHSLLDALLANICCILLSSSMLQGDELGSPAAANSAAAAEVAKTPSLPKSLGRFRQVYFYQSQGAEVLPSTFRPIEVEELDRRVQKVTVESPSPSDVPQLIRSVYVASLDKDRLVSSQSYWDITYRGQSPARLAMGKLGLAIRVNSSDATEGGNGRIVSDLLGEASVVIDRDTRVPFSWSAAGKSNDRALLFDLQIPISIQTRFLIEVPRDMQVQAIDGVGRTLPSPPLEAVSAGASSIAASNATAWYSIEAGAMSRVRLRIVSSIRGEVESVLPIRQASIQYDLQPQSIRFTSRMLVDLRAGSMLPMMAVDAGQVTSIRISGTAVPWSEVTTADGVGIRIDANRIESASGSGTMNITIEGESKWDPGSGLQSLPWPMWRGCRPILVATEMQAQIRLDRSLNAFRVQLPTTWRFSPTAMAEDGSRLFRCVGGLTTTGPAVLMRPEEKQSSAESVLRLSATQMKIQGQLDASILMSETGPQPIHLRMDRGWTAELVTVSNTGRVVDLPSDPALRRRISIWPTSDEVVGGRFNIRVIGTMSGRSVEGRIEFPATSFATIQNCRNRLVAVATPPPGFNWTGDVALRTTRIAINKLTALQRELIGEVSADSLLIELNEGRLAALTSRRPDISFDTTSRLALRFEGDRLTETCLIACDSSSTDIQTIMIDLGAASGRPPMQWSALRLDGSNRRIASTTRVKSETGSDSDDRPVDEQAEIWRIELGETGERTVMLVGRREYGIVDKVQIPLPTVPGASNQSAQVVVMPSLCLTRLGESVLKVPRLANQKNQLHQYGAISADTDPVPGSTVLRYDATENASIEVTPSNPIVQSPLIWRELVEVEISNRGGDAITASYDIDREGDLLIDHDVNLRLMSVANQAGKLIAYEASPTQLVVRVSKVDSRVVTKWNRSVFSASIARRWSAPQLNVLGTVLRRDWNLKPVPDTLIPASILFGETIDKEPMQIRLDASENHVWIVDSGLGYACASMLGMCLFAFGWSVAKRFPFWTALIWVWSIIPAMFLFSTTTLWIASVSVPLAAGGLVAMTQLPAVARKKLSSDGTINWAGRVASWIVFGSIAFQSLFMSGRLQAQSPAVLPPTNQSIDNSLLLVPTTADGELAGTKVYVSNQFYADLLRDRPLVAVPLHVKAASYRLRIDGATDTKTTTELEIRYQLEDTAQRTEARLPIRAAQIRGVQWLTDSDTRPLRWSADGDSAVRLILPAATNANLLIRASVDLQTPSRMVRRIRFPIPQITSASLTVDAGFAVQRLELAKSIGEIDAQPDLGRLNAAIGAVNEIDLTITYREAVRAPVFIAQRRYWIHAGYDRTNVECELDLSDSAIRKGTDVPVVLLDGQRPLVTTDDWTIMSSEAVSPLRQQLIMRSQRDNPGPICFLWELDSLVTSTSAVEDPVPIVIPEIISAGTAITPPAVIALDPAQGLKLVPQLPPSAQGSAASPTGLPRTDQGAAELPLADQVSASSGEPTGLKPLGLRSQSVIGETTNHEAIDGFVSSWNGFRGTATEIVTSTSPLARFVLTAPSPQVWHANEVHHLHVRQGELQLSYSATITPGDRLIGPLRIVLPTASELRVLTMNDVTVDTVPRRVGTHDEISLQEPIGPEPIRLRVVLHVRVTQGRFNLPCVSIEPIQSINGTYTLSRDQSLLVEQVVDGGLNEADNPVMGTADQLSGGWVPCWTWRLDQDTRLATSDSGSRVQLPGVFRTETRDVTIESQQRTSLVWDQTRWSIEAVLRLRGAEKSVAGRTTIYEPIDFVNVELPTIWCDNLTIEPAEAWSRQPSIDPATQIVRIRPEQIPEPDGFITIRFRGQRSIETDARFEVPAVRVLGGGKRDVFMTVPKTIEGRLLDWESSAATAVRLPDELSPVLSNWTEDQLVFRSVGGNASVRLAPSRLESRNPNITIADIQLFACPDDQHKGREGIGSQVGRRRGNSPQTVMICRWDISPGRDESINIDLPPDAKPIEVLIDGRVVSWDQQQDHVEVSLALSRLAQSVVLVCEFDNNSTSFLFGIPRIRNIELDETWVTYYEANENEKASKVSVGTREGWTSSTVEDRLVALASSIRKVTESSLSRATDRSQDEIVRWIAPWDQRFNSIANQFDSKSLLTENADSLNMTPAAAQWVGEQRKWQQYLRRIVGEAAIEKGSTSLALSPPIPWRIVTVARHPGKAESLPTVRIAGDSKTLEVLIQILLMLMIAVGLTLLLWRVRGFITPLATHPAVWLFATGIASFTVAPIPVAIAICGVAISAPFLNPTQADRSRKP